jgi:hypothetical protein
VYRRASHGATLVVVEQTSEAPDSELFLFQQREPVSEMCDVSYHSLK